MWRVGYEMYWSDDQGRTTDHAAMPAVIDSAQKFADALGTDSACAIAVSIDVFDVSSPFPSASSGTDTFTPPAGTAEAERDGGYDLMVFRYPRVGPETYAGITGHLTLSDGTIRYWNAYPVDPQGRSYDVDPPADPWSIFMMHEFLHAVVGFYDPVQGWPDSDVHGGCDHGYTTACYVNEQYFTAMMQGRVPENGRMTGMLPADWGKDGTPSHPVRSTAGQVTLTTAAGKVTATLTKVLDAPFTLTVKSISGGIVATASGIGPSVAAIVPAGTYTADVTFPGSARYRPFSSLGWTNVVVTSDQDAISGRSKPRGKGVEKDCKVPTLRGLTLAKARQRLVRAHCRLGKVTRRRHGRGRKRVRSQRVRPGTRRPPGTAIGVVFGPRR